MSNHARTGVERPASQNGNILEVRQLKTYFYTEDGIVMLGNATPEELSEFCRGQLAHFKCPTSVEFVVALPRTATGKLQKYRLREKYWAGRERKVAG